MESGPVEDVFPTYHRDLSMAMLVYWRVTHLKVLVGELLGPFEMVPF